MVSGDGLGVEVIGRKGSGADVSVVFDFSGFFHPSHRILLRSQGVHQGAKQNWRADLGGRAWGWDFEWNRGALGVRAPWSTGALKSNEWVR